MTTSNENEPTIVECETQRFFGILGHGPFQTCGPKFQSLATIAGKAGLFGHDNAQAALLVLCDVPNTADKTDLEWAAAIRVPFDLKEIPEGLEEIVVPGRRCATTIHRGGYEGLPSAWDVLICKWIPSQKLKASKWSRECIEYEVYLNSCEDGTKKEDLKTQLFAPVEAAE